MALLTNSVLEQVLNGVGSSNSTLKWGYYHDQMNTMVEILALNYERIVLCLRCVHVVFT